LSDVGVLRAFRLGEEGLRRDGRGTVDHDVQAVHALVLHRLFLSGGSFGRYESAVDRRGGGQALTFALSSSRRARSSATVACSRSSLAARWAFFSGDGGFAFAPAPLSAHFVVPADFSALRSWTRTSSSCAALDFLAMSPSLWVTSSWTFASNVGTGTPIRPPPPRDFLRGSSAAATTGASSAIEASTDASSRSACSHVARLVSTP